MSDTSPEAVKRLAADLCGRWDDAMALLEKRVEAHRTLLALVDERDALRRQHADATTMLLSVCGCLMRRVWGSGSPPGALDWDRLAEKLGAHPESLLVRDLKKFWEDYHTIWEDDHTRSEGEIDDNG